LEFIKRSNINNFIGDIKRITAKFFTNGDISKAKTLLEGDINEISRSNLTIVASLGGALAITYLFLILFVVS
jgi:Na+/H+ antiporter NhaA